MGIIVFMIALGFGAVAAVDAILLIKVELRATIPSEQLRIDIIPYCCGQW